MEKSGNASSLTPARVKFLLEEAVRRVEEREVVAQVREWYDELKRTIHASGKQEGRYFAYAALFAKRLARPLTDTELESLLGHIGRLDDDRVVEIAFTLEGDAMAAWLADPAASRASKLDRARPPLHGRMGSCPPRA